MARTTAPAALPAERRRSGSTPPESYGQGDRESHNDHRDRSGLGQRSGMSPETVLQQRLARPTLQTKMLTPSGRTSATVEWWSDEEGCGALTSSEEMPGGAFVHFSAIQTDPNEFRTLRPGQKVDAVIEGPLSFGQ